ncbi:MAG: DUF1641 domain-containing protein [Bacteroidales bacterium]|nr:DUF1641 domain-containing protein [Bacteroidales bacterium]
MSDKNIQYQINELNAKVDLILEEVIAQRGARIEKEDLVEDLTIVGKDMFSHAVTSLDKAGIELDGEALTALLIKVVRNIGTFNKMMDTLESMNDLVKDAAPIVNQMGLDAIAKFAEFEQKGYLDFIKELMKISDNIVSHFTVEDVRGLAENVVSILEMVKNMTQPDMLGAINNALTVFKSMDTEDIQEYSMWKAMRAMKTPEMKRSIGFMITFMRNLSASVNKND